MAPKIDTTKKAEVRLYADGKAELILPPPRAIEKLTHRLKAAFGYSSSLTTPQPRNLLGTSLYHEMSGEPFVEEPFMGAWQRNIAGRRDMPESNFAYYSCLSLISGDIGCTEPVLVARDGGPVYSSAHVRKKYRHLQKLLEKPNRYQNWPQFAALWTLSMLQHGNSYIYKDTDQDNNIIGLYILDPSIVEVKRLPNGTVFYRVVANDIIGTENDLYFYASEIIHSRDNVLFGDMIGSPPLLAAALQVYSVLEISQSQLSFQKNQAKPAGFLTAPNSITQEDFDIIDQQIRARHAGRGKEGNLLLLPNGITYNRLTANAQEQQLVEYFKFNVDAICAVFHVPVYKVMGQAPTYNNVEALSLEYQKTALQRLITMLEWDLSYGLGIADLEDDMWVNIDTSSLLRMDTKSRYEAYRVGIQAGWMHPNHARVLEGLEPVEGGDTPYLQQQNYSLAALAKRDAQEDPFSSGGSPTDTPPGDDTTDTTGTDTDDEQARGDIVDNSQDAPNGGSTGEDE